MAEFRRLVDMFSTLKGVPDHSVTVREERDQIGQTRDTGNSTRNWPRAMTEKDLLPGVRVFEEDPRLEKMPQMPNGTKVDPQAFHEQHVSLRDVLKQSDENQQKSDKREKMTQIIKFLLTGGM